MPEGCDAGCSSGKELAGLQLPDAHPMGWIGQPFLETAAPGSLRSGISLRLMRACSCVYQPARFARNDFSALQTLFTDSRRS